MVPLLRTVQHTGRGPTKALTTIDGYLVVVLRDGITIAEKNRKAVFRAVAGPR